MFGDIWVASCTFGWIWSHLGKFGEICEVLAVSELVWRGKMGHFRALNTQIAKFRACVGKMGKIGMFSANLCHFRVSLARFGQVVVWIATSSTQHPPSGEWGEETTKQRLFRAILGDLGRFSGGECPHFE